jgi:phosphoglycolate phosphatase-like HAD superfamily hydrolase
VLGAALGVGDTFLVQDGPAAVDTPARIGDRIIAEASAHGHDPSRIAAMTGAALSLTGAGAGLGPLVPLGDIAETIRRLGARGYHLGIATTDVRSNTVRELTALGVADQLSAIRCGDDEAATKPDPAVLWQIASDWDLDASELLFVGDSRDDLLTARTAATPFVARCHPDRAPRWVTDADAVVASITELVVDDT